MSQTTFIKAVRSGKTIYVGEKRCEQIRRWAVEISYYSDKTITGAQFLHFLIDKFSDTAAKKLIKELKVENNLN